VSNIPLHRYFATTVALITSYVEGKGSNVMACEWTMNVSYQPLRVMSLIDHDTFTHELIAASGEFGVHLSSADQASLSHFAGSNHGRDVSKLDQPEFADRVYPGKKIKVPMLRGCVLGLECLVEQTIEIGNHTGFVGRAVAGRVNRELAPLLYHQGQYFHLGDLIPKPQQPVP
jgi:flavin reductase (DIM6/NTAB) family NADH-FMN oxidoreductase RutF